MDGTNTENQRTRWEWLKKWRKKRNLLRKRNWINCLIIKISNVRLIRLDSGNANSNYDASESERESATARDGSVLVRPASSSCVFEQPPRLRLSYAELNITSFFCWFVEEIWSRIERNKTETKSRHEMTAFTEFVSLADLTTDAPARDYEIRLARTTDFIEATG